ncbi:hypothetical protein SAMN02744037_01178 [Tepidibacter formicigenes DSM 15518]|jgi:hypothetical protein|uniref:Uncharacterized protein n=1 Tax=Tepidibacter formicigenes DSM 15518 TaxID=1123349 RepID=A0A1M6N6F2_9FIRM|nr:hypothetical protein SAMN02744037_01178 [Tepidibacter formicigenes DSM 15518]
MQKITILRVTFFIVIINLFSFICYIIEVYHPSTIKMPQFIFNCIFIYMLFSIIPTIINLIILIKLFKKFFTSFNLSKKTLWINLSLHIFYLTIYIFNLIPVLLIFLAPLIKPGMNYKMYPIE